MVTSQRADLHTLALKNDGPTREVKYASSVSDWKSVITSNPLWEFEVYVVSSVHSLYIVVWSQQFRGLFAVQFGSPA